jgi:hypothetical protein
LFILDLTCPGDGCVFSNQAHDRDRNATMENKGESAKTN